MITQQSQFVQELNVVRDNLSGADVRLAYFIGLYEPKILRAILGVEFYNQLVLENPLTGDWQILVNGGDFVSNGVTYHFEGLKEILPRLIYFHVVNDAMTQPNRNGGQQIRSETAMFVSMGDKQRKNWNDAYDIIYKMRLFIEQSELEGYILGTYEGGRICYV